MTVKNNYEIGVRFLIYFLCYFIYSYILVLEKGIFKIPMLNIYPSFLEPGLSNCMLSYSYHRKLLPIVRLSYYIREYLKFIFISFFKSPIWINQKVLTLWLIQIAYSL